jgi:xylose isomerase
MSQFAVITGFLGSIKNRFMNYQEERSLEQKLEMASRIEGLGGLELCYPADFADFNLTASLLKRYRLGVSAINFRSRRTGRWLRGSFSSHLEAERREVLEELKGAIRFAEELGCNLVSTCPLNEGSDYLFEMDYAEALEGFENAIREAATERPLVQIALEYKLSDPRARSLLGTAGECLAFCQQVGLPNVGVTLDIGHSLYAGERPSQAAVMLSRAQRLFYVHLNDNDKFWDWDMLPGAYNFWDFIEFFYYLRKIGYDRWFAYDVFAKEVDTVETFSVAIRVTKKLMSIANRLDDKRIRELLDRRNPTDSVDYLFSILG